MATCAVPLVPDVPSAGLDADVLAPIATVADVVTPRIAAQARGSVLCLAGPETTETVVEVAESCGLRTVAVGTVAAAAELVSRGGPWTAVVAALGTRRGVDLLLDSRSITRSSLFASIKRLPVPPQAFVFSYRACKREATARRCREAGADAVVCSREGLLELLAPPRAPRVLCLAGGDTSVIVKGVAAACGLEVVMATTNVEAVELVRHGGPWGGVVAALGVQRGVDVIFDKGDDRSSLICAAKGLVPPPVVVVFSHTACRHPCFAQVCTDAGADAVVCTAEDLRDVVAGVEARALLARTRAEPAAVQTATAVRTAEPDGTLDVDAEEIRTLPSYPTVASYPVVARRRAREASLEIALGAEHAVPRKSRRLTDRLEAMIARLPRPLTFSPATSAVGISEGSRNFVRFVHVSDTHHHHGRVHLPPGDVLIHTGDLIGNYGHADMVSHLADFHGWLQRVSLEYRLVAFIAGNHDTLLDERHSDCRSNPSIRKDFLSALPDNVEYLENSGVIFRGLRLWGIPATICRKETMGKRYLSNAFERPAAEREKMWNAVPDDVAVLMTHVPPRGTLSYGDAGCCLLAERLESMARPPKVHCFGHDHDGIGVKVQDETLYINGAQEEVLRAHNGAEGVAWVFDLPAKGK